MKKRLKSILIGGSILAIIGFGYGYYEYSRPLPSMKNQEASLQLLATQLFDEFENNEAASNDKYNGKIIEISGIVKEVQTNSEGMISVLLDSQNDMFGVSCQLDNLTEHKRTKFKKGEKVTFKGKCSGILLDVVIVRCIEV